MFHFKEFVDVGVGIIFFVDITTIGWQDRSAIGSQDGNVLDDDLACDMKVFSQGLTIESFWWLF